MFKRSMAGLLIAACALSTLAHAGNTPSYADDDPAVITEWNTARRRRDPGLRRRHAAAHLRDDAHRDVRCGELHRRRLHRRIACACRPVARASGEAAAAQAAHDVLVALLPAGTASFDAALATRLARFTRCARNSAPRWAREVAKKILEWRANDGWATPQTFTPPALPGVWQPTPPAFAAAGFVQAGDAKPFGLPTPYYYLPRRPPALNSQEYADAVNEIKAIGGVTSTVRTAEQTLQARLWASVGYKENWARRLEPGDALHGAEQQPVADRVRAPVRAGERHACRTACRPPRPASSCTSSGARCTAIQRAGEDMNPATDADPTWMPLLTTPPYPSYAGNMACIGASSGACAGAVLRHQRHPGVGAMVEHRWHQLRGAPIPRLLADRRAPGGEP